MASTDNHSGGPNPNFEKPRHGETVANEQGILCGGDLDSELNALGERQATELAEAGGQSKTQQILWGTMGTLNQPVSQGFYMHHAIFS